MEEDIQQDVPHNTLAHRTGDDIADRAIQRFLGQCVEIRPQLLLFYPPALSQPGEALRASGPSAKLLLLVAAACLFAGVLIAVLVMKVLSH